MILIKYLLKSQSGVSAESSLPFPMHDSRIRQPDFLLDEGGAPAIGAP